MYDDISFLLLLLLLFDEMDPESMAKKGSNVHNR